MRFGRLIWVLAALLALAGAALAVAPLLTALGASGPPENYPGSIVDLKPGYGALLLAVGIAIALVGVVAARFDRPVVAIAAALLAAAAGLSLDAVNAEIHNAVIDRSYSVLELRGPGPISAAIASAVAFLLAVALTIALTAADSTDRLHASAVAETDTG